MKLHFSAEFFPPQTENGDVRLKTEREVLRACSPDCFSVTYGAGGSTRGRTFSVVKEIVHEKTPVMPHLSCIGAQKESLLSLLNAYKDLNITRIMALRGDLPSTMSSENGHFRHAVDLVHFIREHFGEHFAISVAAYPEYHPQASSPDEDLNHFAKKIQAGAHNAVTQYFFNADSYFHFVENAQKKGIHAPIIPGIMPIVSFEKLARFSDSCGAEIPRWIRLKLEHYHNDFDSIRAFGLDVVSLLCRRLLENGAPGLHFYTMNQSSIVVEILKRLQSIGFDI